MVLGTKPEDIKKSYKDAANIQVGKDGTLFYCPLLEGAECPKRPGCCDKIKEEKKEAYHNLKETRYPDAMGPKADEAAETFKNHPNIHVTEDRALNICPGRSQVYSVMPPCQEFKKS